MGILDEYRKQLLEEKEEEEKNFQEEDATKQDEEYKAYQKRVAELKKEMQGQIEDAKRTQQAMVKKIDEKTLTEQNLIVEGKITEIRYKRAYCPECGKELVSKFPPAYNPYTYEKLCVHNCECGQRYNLEYAYPRLVVIDENGEELTAFGI